MAAPVVTPDELLDLDLTLDEHRAPHTPLMFVDLASGRDPGPLPTPAATVLVGLGRGVDPGPMDCTLVNDRPVSPVEVEVEDVTAARAAIENTVSVAPRAAITLAGLLRCTETLPIAAGLVAESLAYSTLLAGAEFRAWRQRTRPRPIPTHSDGPVLLRRDLDTLHLTLNRPDRRNAFGRDMRDAFVDALDLALHDPTITAVEIDGAGPAFCSGGDLDEFGTSDDVATAHLIRLDRSVAARLDRCRDRVHVTVHGACIGAGIEIPSFAGRITARDDAFFQLPELGMGLVPGAGGTVGITRRIGRWRTAYLALSARRIGRATALAWGLVDD